VGSDSLVVKRQKLTPNLLLQTAARFRVPAEKPFALNRDFISTLATA
jgi:hypothetical protein